MLHNYFGHFDGLSTIQQVFNKSFNFLFGAFSLYLRKEKALINFSTVPTTSTTTSYIYPKHPLKRSE
jgi:hypothetical protein